MNAEELRKILQEKGMDWLIAAMVEGSIGYHSPRSAKMLIESALNGEINDACERCLACYKGNLLDMIESDVRGMRFMEQNLPENASRLVQAMSRLSTLTPLQEMTFSMMYPTSGV
jgi:hypothetical protein